MKTNKLTQLTQPTKYSCVTTCLAMLLGEESPDEVVAKFHNIYWQGKMSTLEIMGRLGIQYLKTKNDRLQEGKTYLVTVPSLNIPGGSHQIIIQAPKIPSLVVFDPAKGRPGRKFYQSFHLPLEDNSEYLNSWTVDAEILGIEVEHLSELHGVQGGVTYSHLKEQRALDHNEDFDIFMKGRKKQ